MARTKKPAPSAPTADKLEQLNERLRTLARVGDPQQVDKQLEQLLRSMGIDPADPDAWRIGFFLLACLHYDVGKPPRTNSNAEKWSRDHDLALLREMVQARSRQEQAGSRRFNREQAIKELVHDRSKHHLFPYKKLSSNKQRQDALRARLNTIRKRTKVGDAAFTTVFGSLPQNIIEEALRVFDLALVEASIVKNKLAKMPRS